MTYSVIRFKLVYLTTQSPLSVRRKTAAILFLRRFTAAYLNEPLKKKF